MYDQYGEEGLKGGVPTPDAGGPGGFSHFSTGGGPQVRFNPRSADDIFSEFFGFGSTFGGGGVRSSRFGGMFGDEDVFPSFAEGAGRATGSMAQGLRKEPPIEQKLSCSLEELYKGTTKKLKLSRNVVDANG